MTASERQPHPVSPGPGLSEHSRAPVVMQPPPDDNDADDIAGWSGVVTGPRGTGRLSRPGGNAPSASEHW